MPAGAREPQRRVGLDPPGALEPAEEGAQRGGGAGDRRPRRPATGQRPRARPAGRRGVPRAEPVVVVGPGARRGTTPTSAHVGTHGVGGPATLGAQVALERGQRVGTDDGPRARCRSPGADTACRRHDTRHRRSSGAAGLVRLDGRRHGSPLRRALRQRPPSDDEPVGLEGRPRIADAASRPRAPAARGDPVDGRGRRAPARPTTRCRTRGRGRPRAAAAGRTRRGREVLPDPAGELGHLGGVGDEDGPGLADQRVAPRRRHARHRPGHRADRQVEVAGLLGRGERARPQAGLDDDGGPRQRGDEPVAGEEAPPVGSAPRRAPR